MVRPPELALAVVMMASLAVLAIGCDPEIDPAENARYEATGKARLRNQETVVNAAVGTTIPRPPTVTPVAVYDTHYTPESTAANVADAFADGMVTREEYDGAVARTLQCLDAHNVAHSTADYDEVRHQYSYTVVSKEGPESGVSVYDDCWMTFERDVEAQWVAQYSGSAPLQEEAALQCARDSGLAVRNGAELESLYYVTGAGEKGMAAARCIQILHGEIDP